MIVQMVAAGKTMSQIIDYEYPRTLSWKKMPLASSIRPTVVALLGLTTATVCCVLVPQ